MICVFLGIFEPSVLIKLVKSELSDRIGEVVLEKATKRGNVFFLYEAKSKVCDNQNRLRPLKVKPNLNSLGCIKVR